MIQNLFQLGDGVVHRGVVVAPLFPRNDPVAGYITLDEALAGGLRIREVGESGTVPELVVENPLAERVLLYDGEELVSAKQNRILNVSVLVEARSTLKIPVSCVEQGRWSRRSEHLAAAPHAASPELRHRKNMALHEQLLARGVSQGEVWDAVQARASRLDVRSPTGASADTFRAHADSLAKLEAAFPAQPGQCGALLAVGDVLCADAVSRPAAFARLWPKLRRGYMLDALDRLDKKPAPQAFLSTFLQWIEAAEACRQPSAGLGQDVRLRGERVLGSGLELDGELLQLSAFRSENGGRPAGGRIARPSARS